MILIIFINTQQEKAITFFLIFRRGKQLSLSSNVYTALFTISTN